MLSSLFELKNNDAIVMSNIIKKLPEMWRNRIFLISEVGKIVRFFYFHKPPDAESDSIFSDLKRVKTFLRSTFGNHMGKQPTVRSNVGVCSH